MAEIGDVLAAQKAFSAQEMDNAIVTAGSKKDDNIVQMFIQSLNHAVQQ